MTLQVVSLDALAFRATARAIDLLGIGEPRIVVNRAGRAEIVVGDVRRVFDVEPFGVVPNDAAVPRAQDHGRLLPARGRTSRSIDRIAARALASREAVAA